MALEGRKGDSGAEATLAPWHEEGWEVKQEAPSWDSSPRGTLELPSQGQGQRVSAGMRKCPLRGTDRLGARASYLRRDPGSKGIEK